MHRAPLRRLRGRLPSLLAALLCARPMRAQANSGALDLLLPIGARATALGGAYAAEPGAEAVWWNPAGLARLPRKEIALDHFETFQIKGNAVSLVVPAAGIGAFAATARLFDYGTTPSVDQNGNENGSILTRSVAYGATFSAPLGPRADLGITYRLYQFRIDCVGACASQVSTTSIVDVGAQLRPLPARPLSVGLTLRQLGPSLQVVDKPQADALATRVHLGVGYDVTPAAPSPLTVHLATEVVSSVSLREPELRAGGEVRYTPGNTTLLARAGYALLQTRSESNGPALGLGIAQGRVRLDFARVFETFSTTLGVPPTFISIRVGL